MLDARLSQLEAEEVEFRAGIDVGEDITTEELRAKFDAICIATGAGVPRDLDVAGRELGGVHFAMDFLTAQNRRNNGDDDIGPDLDARDRNVIIIGGGDTGSDCAGTCVRQGARSVKQFELLPQPPQGRASSTPWPLWPDDAGSSHAHEEGCERDWSVATTGFRREWARGVDPRCVSNKANADGRTDFARIPNGVRARGGPALLAMDSPARQRTGR